MTQNLLAAMVIIITLVLSVLGQEDNPYEILQNWDKYNCIHKSKKN